MVDGLPRDDLNTSTVPASETAKNQAWVVRVTALSEGIESETVEDSVTIGNAPPVVTEVTIEPEEAYEFSTLTASATSVDDDGDVLSLDWTWLVNNVVVASDTQVLDGSYFDKHDSVQATVQPADDETLGQTVASSELVILNSPPAITGVALSPTEVYESSTVTCTSEGWTDPDSDPQAYTYTWEVSGTVISETTATLDGTHFSRDDTVACTVTPDDGDSTGEPKTSDAITVGNTAPSITTATLSTTTPQEGDTLTVTIDGAADDDGDTVTYEYAWYVGNTAVATTEALTDTDFAKGDSIYVEVTPTDGTAAGAAVTSDTATVANTPPVLDSATLTPTLVAYSGILTCIPGTATDIDGDTLTYTYSWSVNTTSVTATTETLDSTSFSEGASVFCTITPNDGEEDGTAVDSNTATVNTPPEVTSVSLSPTTPTTDSVISANAVTTDADGDTVTLSYAWTVDSTTLTETGSSLDGSFFDKNQDVYVHVTPNDGFDDGSPYTSSIAVANTPPEGPEISISNEDEGPCSSLEFDGTGDHVLIPADSALDVGQDSSATFTVEGWFHTYSDSANQHIVHKADPTTHGGTAYSDYEVALILLGAPNEVAWSTGPGSSSSCDLFSVTAASASAWHHFAATLAATNATSGTKEIFIDGVSQGTCSYIDKNAVGGAFDLNIGQRFVYGVSTETFDGLIDEIRLSSTVRYSSDFTPETNLAADADTIALWKFDEGIGNTVEDASANGHDGDIYGATWVEGVPGRGHHRRTDLLH